MAPAMQLTFSDHRPTRDCQGYSRRDFLQIGALSSGLLGIPELLSADSSSYLRDRSIVFLFLQGGPSHIEFFDPKMTAPAEVRSVTGEVSTDQPGITFGGTFGRLARMTDKFSIVRSYASGNSGHTYLAVTSAGNPFKASMSSLYARIAGTNNSQTGIPNNTLILPEAIQEDLKPPGLLLFRFWHPFCMLGRKSHLSCFREQRTDDQQQLCTVTRRDQEAVQ